MNATGFLGHRWVLPGLRWIFGLIFLYAGIVKLGSPEDFSDSIASFQILPAALINPLALFFPWFEVCTGGLLLLGWHTRAACAYLKPG